MTRAGHAATLRDLGRAHERAGQLEQAIRYYEQALPIMREVGDRDSEAATRYDLAIIHRVQGEWDRAVAELEQVVDLDRQVQHPNLASHTYFLKQVRHERARSGSGSPGPVGAREQQRRPDRWWRQPRRRSSLRVPTVAELVGRWELVGVAEETPSWGIDWDDAFPEHGYWYDYTREDLVEPIHLWLAGEGFAAAPPAGPASGLVLEITTAATFTESGVAAVAWFGVDGKLDEWEAVPFSGSVTERGYLLADDAKPTPLPDRPDIVCRYDDDDPTQISYAGDATQVTDALAIDGDELVRTVSAINHDLCPSRIRYIYRRI